MKYLPLIAIALALAACEYKHETTVQPQPAAAEVLVRVDAIAVCATDLEIVRHGVPALVDGELPFNKNFTFGHEYMGTVVRLGPAVDEYRVGDRVTVEVHAGCGRCERCRMGMYTACLNYGDDEPERTRRARAHDFFERRDERREILARLDGPDREQELAPRADAQPHAFRLVELHRSETRARRLRHGEDARGRDAEMFADFASDALGRHDDGVSRACHQRESPARATDAAALVRLRVKK